MPKTSQWTRLLVEGVLIVVSILVAFGIEAWWERHRDRVREEEILVQIVEDFRGHSATAERSRAQHRARQVSAAELLQLVAPDAGPEPEEALVGFRSVAFFDAVNFQPGMLETVLANQGLAIVQDDELRAKLARWSNQLAILQDVQRFVIDESAAMDRYLQSRQPLRRGSELEWDPRLIFQDLEFENLLVRQRVASGSIASILETMRDLSDEVVELAEGR